MIPELIIGNKKINFEQSPYIIAEAGSNFNQSLSRALKLIDIAAASGANCVKFQLFKADKLYPDGGSMFEVFKRIELNPEWIPKLAEHSKKNNIDFTCSAFDIDSFEILETAGVALHKIASSEATNLKLVHKIAQSGKPTIISTGMCDMVDIQEVAKIYTEYNNSQFALLQCGADYPLSISDSNVGVIPELSRRFNCLSGFSDHTLGKSAALAAVGLGGRIFEKHFTLNKTDEGPDHFYALEPEELKDYILSIREVFSAIGNREKDMLSIEREQGRRDGLYYASDLKKGHILTLSDLQIKRPAPGLRSRYSEIVLGSQLLHDVQRDRAIFTTDFDIK